MASKQENIQEVFAWITGILKQLEIPYHVVGGLAAIAYGASRPLYDLDIDIEEKDFPQVAATVKPYLTFGPGNFKDPEWDLTMMTIRYKDVDIDISGTTTGKMLDKATGQWVRYESGLEFTEEREIFGSTQPVLSKEALIKNKTILGRPTDLDDINAINQNA